MTYSLRMTMSDRQVVVNADDFGISEHVNEAIFDAHDRGVVSSTTLLIGGPAVEHALQGAASRPSLGIGLHLDTSEFAPMSPAFSHVRKHNPALDVRQTRRPSLSIARAVSDEWRAQLRAASERGILLTHVDSHHFDHVNPLLLPVLRGVLRTSGISKVRGMHNLWVAPPSSVVVAAKSAHRVVMRQLGMRTTNFMCDAGSYLTLADQGRLPSAGTIELMAHPGHPSYEAETERLLVEGASVFGGELVSWREIA